MKEAAPRFRSRRRAELLSVLLLPLVSHAADAPDTPQAPVEIEKIEVVGSNIKRTEVETAYSTKVLTREDIVHTGASTVTELLQNLPEAGLTGNYLSDIGGNNTFAPGASTLSLRGLGENATLVLLNGRRLPSFGLANYQDLLTNIDAIPLNAIDSVQVLRSGGGAVYGSQAVAGVVNIITRKDFNGVEVRAERQQSITSGDFGSTTYDLTGGWGKFNDDGYNVLANLDFYHRDSTLWADLLGYVNKDLTKMYQGIFGGTSFFSSTPNIIDQGTGAASYTGSCNPPDVVSAGLCKFPRYGQVQAVPESDRVNFVSTGTMRLGGRLTGFEEVDYSHLRTTYVSLYPTYESGSGATTWYNSSSNQVLTYQSPYLSGASALNPFPGDDAQLLYRFTDAPNLSWTTADQYRVLGGLRGKLGTKDWEAAAGVMGSKATNVYYAQSASAFSKCIGNYANATIDGQGLLVSPDGDFFNKPGGYVLGGPNSRSLINALFPQAVYDGKSTQYFVDDKLTGDLLQLPAGPLSFAAGVNLADERYTLTPSKNLLAGDLIGNGVSSADSSRYFGALYGELDGQLAQRLEANVAARLDKYQGFAVHVSPRLGLKFKANDALALRASFETGFRAPSLLEAANSTKVAYAPGLVDPARCPSAIALQNALNSYADSINNNPNATPTQLSQAAGATARAQAVYANECGATITEIDTYNPKLRPETSSNFGLGLVFEPAKWLGGTMDYFHLKRRDQINLLSLQQILNGNQPPGTTLSRANLGTSDPSFLARDPYLGVNDFTTFGVTQGPVLYVKHGFQNLGNQAVSGLDWNFQVSDVHLWIGKLGADFNATYTANFSDDQVDPSGANLTGRYGYPKWVANLTVSYTVGDLTNSLRADYTDQTALFQYPGDGYDPAGCVALGWSLSQCHVPSSTTYSYFGEWRPTKQIRLDVAIANLFARKAPTDLRAFDQNSGIYPVYNQDAKGRMLKVAASYHF